MKSTFILSLIGLMLLSSISSAKMFTDSVEIQVGSRTIKTNKSTQAGTPVVPMWSAATPTTDQRNGAGFPILSDAEHTMVWQPAIREDGAYNHYACLIYYKGKFFAMWGNHELGEDAPGQRVLFSNSEEWGNWANATELFPAPGPVKPRREEGIHLKPDRWVIVNDVLYAVTYVHGAGRYPIARSVDENGGLGEPFLVSNLPGSGELPVFMSSTVVPPVAGQINQWYQDNNQISWWAASAEGVQRNAIDGSQLIESFSYRTKDNTSVVMLRNWGTPSNPVHNNRMYVSFKRGSGNWGAPYPTDIPDSPSRAQAITLSDGTILLIGNQIAPTFDNALYFDRDPMTVSVSKDGYTFDKVYALRTGSPTGFRFSGVGGRNPGYAYSSSVIHKDTLYTLYSIGKEDMAITRVALKSIDPLFGEMQLLTWRFHDPDNAANNALGTETNYISTSLNPAVSGSLLRRGDGLKSIGLQRAFSSSSRLWYSTSGSPTSNVPVTKTMAEEDDAYYEFDVTAKAGFKISLSALKVNIRRTSTGNNGYIWKYSVNSGVFTEIAYENEIAPNNLGGILTADHTLDTGSLIITRLSEIPELQNISHDSKITFRLYGWGATNAAGSFALGRSSATINGETYTNNPLVLSGMVTEESNPVLGFNLVNAQGNEVTYSATTVNENLNISPVLRGPGLNPVNGTLVRSFGSVINNYETNTRTNLEDAISAGDYYQFTLKAKPGYYLSLSSLDVTLRRSAFGATKYQWKYSLDGENFTEIGYYNDIQLPLSGLSQPQIPLSDVVALQNLSSGTTVTFRLYVWGTTASTGTIAIGRYSVSEDANSISVGGFVEEVTILPVKLLSFTAKPQGNIVQLNWSAASETNNLYFEILRSEGNEFKEIGIVKGKGTYTIENNYSYTDYQPLPGVSYYKLRQVDNDGKWVDSHVIPVSMSLKQNHVKVYGSIGQQKVMVWFYAEKEGTGKISVINTRGNVIATRKSIVEKGYNYIEIPVSLQKELYIIDIGLNGSGNTVKFIAQ